MLKIFIIDENIETHNAIGVFLPANCRISSFHAGNGVTERVKIDNPGLIFLGSNISDITAITLLNEIMSYNPQLPIIFMHEEADCHLAMEVAHIGAFNFLLKPTEFNLVPSLLHMALRNYFSQLVPKDNPNNDHLNKIIGSSLNTIKLKKEISKMAPSDFSVMILGESGTGKELVAEIIHNLSTRYKQPFIPLNCAAIPNTLFETELFGCRRGAYTGAVDRIGFLEKSSSGTLFLDEIAEIPKESQASLFRVLEEKKVIPLGSSESYPINCRFISATNQEVCEKNMRSELFYRLATLIITIKPLRKRKEEIPDLSKYFLANLDPPYSNKEISYNALEKLASHNWPGNVRELSNVIDGAVVKCEGKIIRPHHIKFFKFS